MFSVVLVGNVVSVFGISEVICICLVYSVMLLVWVRISSLWCMFLLDRFMCGFGLVYLVWVVLCI